jgi:hypothetical protein
MGLSAISDFTGFNQIAASSNIAMIYKYNVCLQKKQKLIFGLFTVKISFRVMSKVLVLIHCIIRNTKHFD